MARKKKTADQMIGNNDFIDARNNVKTAFIISIIAAFFALICINYYKDGYKLQLIITHLIKVDGQDYTNAFVDMIWWLNLLSFVSTAAIVAGVIYCRFKWASKMILAVPAGIKLVCAALLVFILYTRNYATIIAKEGVYDFNDLFLISSIVYIAAHLLVFVSIFLPEKLLSTVAITGILLLTAVGIAGFFFATPYAIPYQLFSSKLKTGYAYRGLSAQIAEFASALAIFVMAKGLDVYHRCVKEDKANENA